MKMPQYVSVTEVTDTVVCKFVDFSILGLSTRVFFLFFSISFGGVSDLFMHRTVTARKYVSAYIHYTATVPNYSRVPN